MGSIRHPVRQWSVHCASRASPHEQCLKAIQHVYGTYLKHQPEQENHSNTGNNICMVLDDKLMAQHRRVLVSFFPDPHVDAVLSNFCFALRSADVAGFYQIVVLAFFARRAQFPCLLLAQGQTEIEWRVTLLLVGGSTERESCCA